RPARRNDNIVRAAFVIEIALSVAVPTVLDIEPLALTLHGNVAALEGWQDPASAVDNGHLPAGGGLAEGGGFDSVARETREIDDQHADFRGPIHAARRHSKRLLDIGKRVRVHRLARERNFVELDAIAIAYPGIFEQPKDRGSCRHVGDLK